MINFLGSTPEIAQTTTAAAPTAPTEIANGNPADAPKLQGQPTEDAFVKSAPADATTEQTPAPAPEAEAEAPKPEAK